jgi:DNA invertase Pin-like site-specific DNA recombinase
MRSALQPSCLNENSKSKRAPTCRGLNWRSEGWSPVRFLFGIDKRYTAIDTSTPVGKMTFTVLGAVAELERSLIVERTRAGQRNAKLNGKHIGRPRACVNDTEIRSLLDAGNSMSQVAEILGVSAATICRRTQSAEW